MDYRDLLRDHPQLFGGHAAPLHIVDDPAQVAAWQARRRAELAAAGQPAEWADLGVLAEDEYVLFVRDLVEFPDGRRAGYNRVVNVAALAGGPCVVVLPLVGDDAVLLRIFRHPTRAWHHEVPRGFGEPGLSAADNARKEIEEEIGGEVEALVDLGEMHANSGLEAVTARIFVARLTRVGRAASGEGIERIDVVPVARLERMIADGSITDGFTIAAWARARLRGVLPAAGGSR